jgi:MFS transporter, UMF1 family
MEPESIARGSEPETRKSSSKLDYRRVVPWALYDWANSAFAVTVMTVFFPVFLKDFWCPPGTLETVSTFRLSMANSIASAVVAVLAPVLGAIADRGGVRKRFLLFFAAMGIVMTGSLHFVARGHWQIALLLYVLSIIGFSGGNIFYDSLLVSVAGEKKLHVVSALGFSLGYLGGGLLFALNVVMVLHPEKFGLADASEAVRRAFLIVSVWWAVFSIPLFLFVRETGRPEERAGGWQTVKAGLRQLGRTFREVRALRTVFLFLVGYWLYIDGVDTVVLMAVDYGKSLGFPSDSLIKAILITQFVGFPAAIVFGKLGEKLGAKIGIFIALAVYIGVAIWGYFMSRPEEFYVLAVVVGLVQGGIQALSRSLYAHLIPKDKAGEFFGFYNMLGKFAAIIGPSIMGVVGVLTGNPRLSILAIIVLFVGGGALLYFVREQRAESKGAMAAGSGSASGGIIDGMDSNKERGN